MSEKSIRSSKIRTIPNTKCFHVYTCNLLLLCDVSGTTDRV